MAKHITRWSPDTHEGVVIDFEWDDENPNEYSVKQIVNGCNDHKTKSECDHFAAVLEENQRVNKTKQLLVENAPSICEEKLDDNGSAVTVIKKSAALSYAFKKDTRELEITVSEITAEEKSKMQSEIVKCFGANKVKII